MGSQALQSQVVGDVNVKDDEDICSICFDPLHEGVVHIPKEQQKNWDARIEMLLETIQYWIDNQSEKQIEIIQLYYY
tara:strand:- start:79 stop:309 length:231 start_codon:yes stop_codon:yes gene_type:complete